MTEISRSIQLGADRERVWRALTDAGELAQWFGRAAKFEARPGAEGWFEWDEGRFHCRVEAVDPPRRLTWRWASPADTPVEVGPATLVEWTLESRADGGTTLTVRESGFHSDEARRENERGWQEELAELGDHVASSVAEAGAAR